MDLPQRKQNRLPEYDYSSPGVYFVTICTKDMAEMFWRNTEPTALIDVPFVGEITDLPQPSSIFEPSVQLSNYGQLVDHAIQNIPLVYPMITVNKYVIMPNHVHLLLQIHTDAECVGEPGSSMISPTEKTPTIMTIVRHLKGFATRAIGFSVWQRSFHDHIVRTEQGYRKIWQYIDQNPLKWDKDCFHPARFPKDTGEKIKIQTKKPQSTE